ncbi:MAG: NYN domain-containing protein [Acidobacteriota bacterium]
MPYLIDGNNLIGLTAGLSLKDARSRQLLVRRICAYQRRKGGKYTVYFDGEPETGPLRHDLDLRNVAVRFSGRGVTADDMIQRVLRRAAHPREYTVVSSDRELARACKELGARQMSCADFNAQMRKLEAKPLEKWESPVTAAEVEEWLRLFREK